MFGELVGFVAIVALMVVVWRQQQRLRVLEFDLEGLRTAFLAHREKVSVRQRHAQARRRPTAIAAWRTRRSDRRAPSASRALAASATADCRPGRRRRRQPEAARCRRSRSLPRRPGRGRRKATPAPSRQPPPAKAGAPDHRDRARHALGGLGRRPGAGAGRHLPRPLFDRGRHFRPRSAADPRRHPRRRAGRRPASSSAAPASRCRSKASPTPMFRAS